MKLFGKSNSDQNDLARIYIVYQKAGKLYPPMEALQKGTIFPGLYRPYKIKQKG